MRSSCKQCHPPTVDRMKEAPKHPSPNHSQAGHCPPRAAGGAHLLSASWSCARDSRPRPCASASPTVPPSCSSWWVRARSASAAAASWRLSSARAAAKDACSTDRGRGPPLTPSTQTAQQRSGARHHGAVAVAMGWLAGGGVGGGGGGGAVTCSASLARSACAVPARDCSRSASCSCVVACTGSCAIAQADEMQGSLPTGVAGMAVVVRARPTPDHHPCLLVHDGACQCRQLVCMPPGRSQVALQPQLRLAKLLRLGRGQGGGGSQAHTGRGGVSICMWRAVPTGCAGMSRHERHSSAGAWPTHDSTRGSSRGARCCSTCCCSAAAAWKSPRLAAAAVAAARVDRLPA